MDLIIALTAEAHGLTLAHVDADFDAIAKVRPGLAMVRIDQPVPVEMNASAAALSRAESTLPIDCSTPRRRHAVSKASLVYGLAARVAVEDHAVDGATAGGRGQ
jgi:hypothetical protein